MDCRQEKCAFDYCGERALEKIVPKSLEAVNVERKILKSGKHPRSSIPKPNSLFLVGPKAVLIRL